MKDIFKKIEHVFETLLFNCRFLVMIAVISSLAAAMVMFLKGGYEVLHGLIVFANTTFGAHLSLGGAHGEEMSLAVLLIEAVDSFLFATVLLIFSMGLYELFISGLDPASMDNDDRPEWLSIHSLDDLKNALGKVILMILIVRLFEAASQMGYEKPLDLLYLGLAVGLVSLALFLVHQGHKQDHKAADNKHAKSAGGDNVH